MKLNEIEMEEHSRKWWSALIGYVLAALLVLRRCYRPMILKEWVPDFKLNKEPLRFVPLWVSFPKLPLQCWTEENLGRLASYLGRPICTDKLTAKGDRISYARILIKMDITQPLPDKVTIESSDDNIWNQDIE